MNVKMAAIPAEKGVDIPCNAPPILYSSSLFVILDATAKSKKRIYGKIIATAAKTIASNGLISFKLLPDFSRSHMVFCLNHLIF